MIPDLNRVLLRGEPMQRRAAIVSLRQIGDPGTIGTASALLTDSDLLVRRAALNLLKQFPEEAIRIGRNLVEDADLSLARMGVRLIAAQKEQESYERLGDLLMDPRPGIRLEAVLSLDGDVPLLYRDAVRQLQNDPVPEVRAAARGIDFD
jgi:HEAT repeat protein